jgi:hypothetical protein
MLGAIGLEGRGWVYDMAQLSARAQGVTKKAELRYHLKINNDKEST